jgi:GT2 family glycosyltransferase
MIIVDQSDNDLTRDALQPFLQTTHVRYIASKTYGLATGRNIGIREARSEYIAITDDDCEVSRNWLRAMAETFEINCRIGLVFGNVAPAPHDSSAGFVPSYERQEPFLARSIHEKQEVEGIAGCMGLRRSVWQALGGFDERLGLGASLKSAEESDFTIRVLLAAYFVYETPALHLVHYGFYTWDEGRSVVQRNWFGTGAMFAKHFKCGHWSVVRPLLLIAWRWVFGRSRGAVSLGMYSYKCRRLVAFLQGMAAGFRTPVNRKTGQFL